jgi:uncharacterized protein DUF4136
VRSHWSRVAAACLVLVVGACSQFKVQAKQDPRVGFASLRTFAWLPKAEAEPADQDVQHRGFDRQIRADVDKALREKGYVPATDGRADFLLNYRVSSTPSTAMRGARSSVGGWGGYWVGWPGWEGAYTENYDQGALFIAALDPATKHMIWLGVARARLLPHISYDRSLKRIDDAVAQILASFPRR